MSSYENKIKMAADMAESRSEFARMLGKVTAAILKDEKPVVVTRTRTGDGAWRVGVEVSGVDFGEELAAYIKDAVAFTAPDEGCQFADMRQRIREAVEDYAFELTKKKGG